MNMQVVCDHNGRITYLVGGWPGSVHDNRAWRNCCLFVNADTFFNFEEGEYLVGKKSNFGSYDLRVLVIVWFFMF